jgi:hypothetical protein
VLINTTIGTEGSKSVLLKATHYENLRITVILLVHVAWRELNTVCYSEDTE